MSKSKIDRRLFVASSAAMLTAPASLRAQSAWPAGRNIRIVVPFPPAGATDVLGRIMAERFGEFWGARVVVENKPGAGGNIGAEQVARSAPDGDNILIFSVGMATNPHLYQNMTYDPIKDFEPVSLIAMVPNILIAGKHTPYSNAQEFVAFAKANPGKITYGSSGIGTSLHLAGELFQKMTGTKMQHVPYRGAALAIQDLLAGQIDVVLDNITSALPQARAGAVKGLAITTAKRSQFAPELQPLAEVVPGFDVTSWFALFVPKGTPRPIIDRIAADVRKALAEPAVKEKMASLAADSVGSTPEELAALLRSETEKWGILIREAGIKAN
ncbi:MAG: tripartite tricarboxylate transporter substrate binding protein [Methylocystis sp.]|nr:tripartite tricarboxylate transporter substrate binding protein [Methylocystis sp.]MCA3584390.1 tripartite tricarboxylate transporter substrate binding protein [Methylocystis sp.]MCA3587972.1 tripartite tricarboxylate transporter substrate binding protein [Methylocystis sp.]MCA3592589.1 tripartite tricarboxylate transporter substrate binding protein [Methylocystis sp.]